MNRDAATIMCCQSQLSVRVPGRFATWDGIVYTRLSSAEANLEHSISLCVGATSWCTPSLVRSIGQISGTGDFARRGAAPCVGRSCWVVRMGGKAGGGTVRACGGVDCDNVRRRGGGVCEWVARGMLTCKSRVMQRSWQMERSTNGWTGRGDSVGGTATEHAVIEPIGQ